MIAAIGDELAAALCRRQKRNRGYVFSCNPAADTRNNAALHGGLPHGVLTWEGELATNVSFLGPVARAKSRKSETKRLSQPVVTLSQTSAAPERIETATAKDYFVERNGLRYAGTHLLIDLWKARGLDNLELVEAALRSAVAACGATLLNIHLHHFSPNGGISGVAVLAESHISIHTWPEREFAAIDIFMCGSCDPYKAIPVLRQMLATDSIQLNEQRRGLMP